MFVQVFVNISFVPVKTCTLPKHIFVYLIHMASIYSCGTFCQGVMEPNLPELSYLYLYLMDKLGIVSS